MKNFDVKGYYKYEKELPFITETLSILYNIAI